MGKMKNAPLYFTIAQVRYNPILSLSTYIPAVQEHFRKNGFPDFKKSITMMLNLTPLLQNQGGEGQIPPSPIPAERYSFSNVENTQNFHLEQNALAFQATEYDVFGNFAAHLLQGLEVLDKAVGLSFVERIGVRYLDAVMPKKDEELHKYLIPEVMGLYKKLNGKVEHSFSETLTQAEDGSTMSRTIIQDGRVGFPPDLLQSMNLKVAERFQNFVGAYVLIDTDAFHVERMPFNLTEVKKKLGVLHDKADKSFHATITDYARSVWA